LGRLPQQRPRFAFREAFDGERNGQARARAPEVGCFAADREVAAPSVALAQTTSERLLNAAAEPANWQDGLPRIRYRVICAI
jgi:hypothetical protein